MSGSLISAIFCNDISLQVSQYFTHTHITLGILQIWSFIDRPLLETNSFCSLLVSERTPREWVVFNAYVVIFHVPEQSIYFFYLYFQLKDWVLLDRSDVQKFLKCPLTYFSVFQLLCPLGLYSYAFLVVHDLALYLRVSKRTGPKFHLHHQFKETDSSFPATSWT
jgi:hypothetical protein